ncbi:DUF6457 domain-containing protein [Leucobacter sp. wl10]|uniref:DUF6457 domain-containing protein n=1 Tax=Leucobacter sp. wl10 TaxID=2304677 RepID=UPI0019691586|nr:DUF6457 domain-containing protein [Leucobacter sp. wl10]
MNAAAHLPPSALDDWVIAASAELGLDPDTAATSTVLDLARDVAHDVARPAAPVSAYLLGLAVGRAERTGSSTEQALAELSQRLVALAARHRGAGG